MDRRVNKMEKIFTPKSIAFVGATNNIGKWGGIILHNLRSGGYQGEIYPVNPKDETVHGLKAYKSVTDIPGDVDLAIFTIPAELLPRTIGECGQKGVEAGVVISAGFAELGEEGKGLQDRMLEEARRAGMVLVGPNGQGISVPKSGLHPWMPMFKPDPGSVAVVSQSGNVATVLAEQLAELGFGCSKAISAGNCADLTWSDYLDYFRQDSDTRVVLMYVEGVGSGRDFFEAAKRTALVKPVIVVKSGRTEAGSRAAASHTGVLAGSDLVFDSACKQAGIQRAQSMEEAVIAAASMVNTPLPKGRRLGVVTGGGGLGVMAADAAARMGLDLVKFSDETIEKLKAQLPSWWAPNNPVDMVAGLGYGGPRELVPILMESGEVDGVILLGVGWFYSMFDAVNSRHDFHEALEDKLKSRQNDEIKYCEALRDFTTKWDKPFLMTSSVARLAVRRRYEGLLRIIESGSPLYPTLEDAVRAFAAMADRHEFLKANGAAW